MNSPPPADLQGLHTRELLSLCAANTDDTVVWVEFMRRFSAQIRHFIHHTLRQSIGVTDSSNLGFHLGGAQEGDLFQATILKLVERDCSVIRRFSGSDEAQFLAYLAVISRSVVRDHLRRQRAFKRPMIEGISATEDAASSQRIHGGSFLSVESDPDRHILAREVVDLSMRAIRRLSGPHYARNELIFQLYYANNLSAAQIAQCRGVGLSKAGIEKVLSQIREEVRAETNQELLRVTP